VFRFSPDHPHVSIADQLGQQVESAMGSDTRIDLVSNKHGKPLHEISPAKIMTEVDWNNVSMRFRPDQKKRDPNLAKIHMKDPREMAQAEFDSYVDTLTDHIADHISDHITKNGAAGWKERADKIGCRQKMSHHMARVLKAHGKRCHPKVSYGQYLMTHGVLYPSQFVDYLSYRTAHAVNDVHDFYHPAATTSCHKLKAVIKHRIKKAMYCNKIFRWMASRWERCFRFIRCINGYRDCRVDKYGRRKASKETKIAKWHGYKSGGSSSSSSSSSDSGSSSDDECGHRGRRRGKGKRCGRGRGRGLGSRRWKLVNEKIGAEVTDDYGRVRPDLMKDETLVDSENNAQIAYSDDEEMPIGITYSDDEAINKAPPAYSDDDELVGAYLENDNSDGEISGAYLENYKMDDALVAGFYRKNKKKDKGKGKKKSKGKKVDPEISGAYLLPDSGKKISNEIDDPELVGAYLADDVQDVSDEDEFAGAFIDESAASSVPSSKKKDVVAVDNPTDMFHKLWNKKANQPLIRKWIGSDTENTHVLWPDKLKENLDSPQKVEAFLKRQSFKVPLTEQVRNQTFQSIDGTNNFSIDAEEKRVNGMLIKSQEIAGGSSATFEDFPLGKGRIFVRSYQTE